MDKKLVMLGMVIGSTVGGYLPTLFGASTFSIASVAGTLLGGALGIWLFFKIAD